MSYKQNRRDSTEGEIVRALRAAGCLVLYAKHPDLIVQRPDGEVRLVECKSRTGRITDSQQKLIDDGWNLHIVRTEAEALAAVLA